MNACSKRANPNVIPAYLCKYYYYLHDKINEKAAEGNQMEQEIENQGNEEEVTNESITIPILGQGRELVIWLYDSMEDGVFKHTHHGERPPLLVSPRADEYTQGWVCIEDEYIHVAIKDMPDDPARQGGIIAHECLHVVSVIHRKTGQNFNVEKNGDDEFACYLLQWLVEQCYLKLTNHEEE